MSLMLDFIRTNAVALAIFVPVAIVTGWAFVAYVKITWNGGL